jgi:hypothetical protein
MHFPLNKLLYGVVLQPIDFLFFHVIHGIQPHNVEELESTRQLDLARESVAPVRVPYALSLGFRDRI